MNRLGFWQGVAAAAVLAVAGGGVTALLLPILGAAGMARLLVPALSLAYLLFLLPKSRVRSGRLTVFAAWAVVSVAAWWLVASFALYLFLHVGFLWLARSLYFHRGIFASLADGALAAGGSLAALLTLQQTGSVLLSIWAFFLLQALFAVIPERLRSGGREQSESPATTDSFEDARRRAEAALHELMAR